MKKIINTKNIIVEEVEEDDENNIDKWIKKEFKETYPFDLVKTTFPKNVMDIISSDHHKGKDYSFSISYDHSEEKWYIAHDGYVREVEVEGESYASVAKKYLYKI